MLSVDDCLPRLLFVGHLGVPLNHRLFHCDCSGDEEMFYSFRQEAADTAVCCCVGGELLRVH